jgi:hypothetical protein
VDGQPLNGAQIVLRLSQDYSVNPRLLLALLEHQTKWLTNLKPEENEENYPVGLLNPQSKGLYRQLSWAADQLNRGYYLWRVNGVGAGILKDGSVVPATAINAGTADCKISPSCQPLGLGDCCNRSRSLLHTTRSSDTLSTVPSSHCCHRV